MKVLYEEPCEGKLQARFWCAMKVIQVMKVGPSVGVVQANLPNNLNAAVIKSYGSERLRKRLYKIVMCDV